MMALQRWSALLLVLLSVWAVCAVSGVHTDAESALEGVHDEDAPLQLRHMLMQRIHAREAEARQAHQAELQAEAEERQEEGGDALMEMHRGGRQQPQPARRAPAKPAARPAKPAKPAKAGKPAKPAKGNKPGKANKGQGGKKGKKGGKGGKGGKSKAAKLGSAAPAGPVVGAAGGATPAGPAAPPAALGSGAPNQTAPSGTLPTDLTGWDAQGKWVGWGPEPWQPVPANYHAPPGEVPVAGQRPDLPFALAAAGTKRVVGKNGFINQLLPSIDHQPVSETVEMGFPDQDSEHTGPTDMLGRKANLPLHPITSNQAAKGCVKRAQRGDHVGGGGVNGPFVPRDSFLPIPGEDMSGTGAPYRVPKMMRAEDIEDCVACRYVWLQVEGQVGNTPVESDVYDAFKEICIFAQDSPVFFPACQDMFNEADDMIGDYMDGYTVNQLCENSRLCRIRNH